MQMKVNYGSLQVVSMLRHARLSSHFFFRGDPLTIKRAHFTSIQFETDREKEGCAKWKASASLFFGERLAAARKLSDPPKKKKKKRRRRNILRVHYISTRTAKSPHCRAHTSIRVSIHARSHNQIVAHPHRKTSIRAVAVFFFLFLFSLSSSGSAIQSAVGFCLCQITSSICQPN